VRRLLFRRKLTKYIITYNRDGTRVNFCEADRRQNRAKLRDMYLQTHVPANCATRKSKPSLIRPYFRRAFSCLVKLYSVHDSKMSEIVCTRQLNKYGPLSRTYDFTTFPRKNTNRVCSHYSEAKDKDWRR
jgi:hypothetical protein